MTVDDYDVGLEAGYRLALHDVETQGRLWPTFVQAALAVIIRRLLAAHNQQTLETAVRSW